MAAEIAPADPPEALTAEVLEALTTDLIDRHPAEAARTLEDLDLTQAVGLLTHSPPPRAARMIELSHPDRSAAMLQALDSSLLADVVQILDLQYLASLVARLEADEQAALLDTLDEATATELSDLMSYQPNTAGALMDPRVLVFKTADTVDQALTTLRELGRPVGVDVQVVDDDSKLVGRLAVQTLLSAPGDATAGELAQPPVAVAATAGLEEILEIGGASRSGVSVVDVNGRLLGVIRRNRLTSAAEEEASADLQTMVGVSKEERALSSPGLSVRRRLPWLYINLATAFLAAAVVGMFESTIAQVTALAVLLPVVAGQSGNSGSQALAVTMRGLALREVRVSQWKKVGGKELIVGAVNGVAVAVVTAIGVFVWSGSVPLGLVIAVAMVISMAMAGLAGAAIPMALKALGQDPAQSSSIFLTTVTDIVGFTSFLGLATVFASFL